MKFQWVRKIDWWIKESQIWKYQIKLFFPSSANLIRYFAMCNSSYCFFCCKLNYRNKPCSVFFEWIRNDPSSNFLKFFSLLLRGEYIIFCESQWFYCDSPEALRGRIPRSSKNCWLQEVHLMSQKKLRNSCLTFIPSADPFRGSIIIALLANLVVIFMQCVRMGGDFLRMGNPCGQFINNMIAENIYKVVLG